MSQIISRNWGWTKKDYSRQIKKDKEERLLPLSQDLRTEKNALERQFDHFSEKLIKIKIFYCLIFFSITAISDLQFFFWIIIRFSLVYEIINRQFYDLSHFCMWFFYCVWFYWAAFLNDAFRKKQKDRHFFVAIFTIKIWYQGRENGKSQIFLPFLVFLASLR